jgi:hypothetical protein
MTSRELGQWGKGSITGAATHLRMQQGGRAHPSRYQVCNDHHRHILRSNKMRNKMKIEFKKGYSILRLDCGFRTLVTVRIIRKCS